MLEFDSGRWYSVDYNIEQSILGRLYMVCKLYGIDIKEVDVEATDSLIRLVNLEGVSLVEFKWDGVYTTK